MDKKPIAAWLFSNIYLVATAFLQLVSFIVLGRYLGAIEYGIIISVTVFVTLAVEFVGLGCGDSLIKKVSTNKSVFSEMITECLVVCAITLLPVAAVVTLLLAAFNTNSIWLIGILVVTELYSTRVLALIDHTCIALSQITVLNRVKLFYAASRLLIITIACLVFNVSTAWQWVFFQIICSVLLSTFLLSFIVIRFGGIKKQSTRHLKLTESIKFSLTQVLRACQNNVDKYGVQFIFDALTFSLYAVAGRFMQYSLIPLQALLRVSYPKFFQSEKKQKGSAINLSFKLLPVVFGVSLIPFLFMQFGGPLVELALGSTYESVSVYMALLSPLPVLMAFQYLYMDVLTAINRHDLRLLTVFIHVATLISGFLTFAHLELESLIQIFIAINAFFVCAYATLAYLFSFRIKRSEVLQ